MTIDNGSIVSEHCLKEMSQKASETPEGIFVEFGVYRGGSARVLADIAVKQNREIHLFDTFTGIPFRDGIDQHNVGDFSDTLESSVRDHVPEAIFHVGVFPDTMPTEFKKIAFLHIDADQYKSYKDAIRLFGPYMVKGSVMWFDDVGCLAGADKAVNEEFGDSIEQSKCKKYFKRF